MSVAGQSTRGYASAVLVDGDVAYVTMGSALVAFDVSDPENPRELWREYATTCFDGNPTIAKLPGGKYFIVP